jgi:hypothetical protein
MDHDAYLAVGGLLKELGYTEIGNYIETHRDNEMFFDSCVNLILHKTPEYMQDHVNSILYLCGILPVYEVTNAKQNT